MLINWIESGNGQSIAVTIGIVFGVIFAALFIFSIIFMLSPKRKAKLLKGQISALSKATKLSEGNLEELATRMGGVAARTRKNILDANGDILKESATKQTDINKEAIKTTARTIKEGLTGSDTIYCKHCGEPIDVDSKFCKKCGKMQ